MEFAILHQERVRPSPRAQASCPLCGANVQAKCGKKLLWHWAHVSLRHCDAWWENETEWHRSWKARYPLDWQEEIFARPPSF